MPAAFSTARHARTQRRASVGSGARKVPHHFSPLISRKRGKEQGREAWRRGTVQENGTHEDAMQTLMHGVEVCSETCGSSQRDEHQHLELYCHVYRRTSTLSSAWTVNQLLQTFYYNAICPECVSMAGCHLTKLVPLSTLFNTAHTILSVFVVVRDTENC
jgi:hypothetical protein